MSTTLSHRPGGGSEESRDLRVLARGGTLGLVGVAISGALQLFLVVAVTRGLGARDAGTFLEAVALFTILANLALLGANTGLVRSIPRARALERLNDVRSTLLVALFPVAVVGVLAGAAVYAFAPELASVFFHGTRAADAVSYLRLFAVVLPLASVTVVALAASRGLGTMKVYVFVQNMGLPAVRLAATLAVIAAGLGGVAVGLAWALPVALTFVVTMTALARMVRRVEQRQRDSRPGRPVGTLASEFWRFSAPRGLASGLGMTVTWMDVLLVGALRSTREAGIYAAASRLSIVGSYALQAVGMAIGPQISALMARGRADRVEHLYRMATWWLMALSWPLYLSFAVFAPFVMSIFGPAFTAGQDALLILSLAMLVNLATGNVTVVLLMGGKSSWNLFNAFVSLALNVTLNLLLIPPYGITGAALAWAVSIVFVNVVPVVQVRLFLGLRPPFGTGYLFVAVAAVLCYGVVGLAVRYGLGASAVTFGLFAVLATLLYVSFLRRFRDVLKLPELRDALTLPARLGAATAVPKG